MSLTPQGIPPHPFHTCKQEDEEQDDDFFTIKGDKKNRRFSGAGEGDDDDGRGVGGGDRSKFCPDLEGLEDWDGTGEGCAIEAIRNK